MLKLRLHRRAVTWAAFVIVAGTGAMWAGHRAWAAFETSHSTPSCSWSLRIRGKPTPAQARLVRCYLRALANRDTAGLLAVAPTIPAVRITGADLAHSADARSGRATVTFLGALVDTEWIPVVITYADGATDRLGVQNMIEMGGPSVWRMSIGSNVSPPGGPPPAVLGAKVSGHFVMVGGPAPGVRLPLPGRIVATNTTGRRFISTVTPSTAWGCLIKGPPGGRSSAGTMLLPGGPAGPAGYHRNATGRAWTTARRRNRPTSVPSTGLGCAASARSHGVIVALR